MDLNTELPHQDSNDAAVPEFRDVAMKLVRLTIAAADNPEYSSEVARQSEVAAKMIARDAIGEAPH